MNRQITKTELSPSMTNSATNSAYYASLEPSNSPSLTRDERSTGMSGEDDLLSSLSNAYENRRARQVFEWETIRRRAEINATPRHFA